jgi:hypothetical protein
MRLGMAGSGGSRAYRELIDVLVKEGASLAEIERDVLAGAPLSEELRDALWLYAWGVLERQSPRVAVPA